MLKKISTNGLGKKIDEEIEKELAEEKEEIHRSILFKSFKWSLVIFVGGVLFSVIRSLTVGPEPRTWLHHNPIAFSELKEYYPGIVEFSFLLSLIFFVFSLYNPGIYRKKHLSASMICNKCFRVKNDDLNYQCECGGKYEKLSWYDWVEEDVDQKSQR